MSAEALAAALSLRNGRGLAGHCPQAVILALLEEIERLAPTSPLLAHVVLTPKAINARGILGGYAHAAERLRQDFVRLAADPAFYDTAFELQLRRSAHAPAEVVA